VETEESGLAPNPLKAGMKLRFSTRDLLWLTLVVALCVAWWASNRRDYRHLQIKGVHNYRSAVLVRDKLSRVYFIRETKQVGPPLTEQEGREWSPSK
jgi:hypothetical protein